MLVFMLLFVDGLSPYFLFAGVHTTLWVCGKECINVECIRICWRYYLHAFLPIGIISFMIIENFRWGSELCKNTVSFNSFSV